MNRRQFLMASGGAMIALPGLTACMAGWSAPDLAAPLAKLERQVGGRLGVAMLDPISGHVTGHRLDERFAFCSTFKLPLAGAFLQAGDQGAIDLASPIAFTRADLMPNSPVTGDALGSGDKATMSVRALCEATQKTSDNTAANVLLKLLGGPDAMTGVFREWGDTVSRIDRMEPMMNRVIGDDPRDTTSPRAIAETLNKLLLGNILSKGSRGTLIQWMTDTETGLKRLRAGLPAGWGGADKTGTGLAVDGIAGLTAKYNDIGLFTPPPTKLGLSTPIIITAYYDTGRFDTDMRDEDMAVLAQVARLATRHAMDARA